MWSTIANLKENLNKMAQDVHDEDDEDEEFEIYASLNGAQASSISDRRNSHSFAHSKSPSRSPIPNGIDSFINPEIEQYKAEIKRLQESEAEIKALSVNYAALLKEKEDQISRLSKENGSLKQNLDSTTASLNASRNENHKAAANGINVLKGSGSQSPNRQQKLTSQTKTGYSGHQKQNGGFYTQDGISNGVAQLSDMQGNERELADLLEEKNRSQTAMLAEMKQLRMELEKERNQSGNVHRKLQEQHKLNEAIQEELKFLKLDREKTSIEISKISNVLKEKMSEINRLQMELNRREDENADDVAGSLKRLIATLEKENSSLKIEKNELEVALKASRTATERNSSDASESLNKHPTRLNEPVDSSESFPGKEEMEKSLQKFDKDLKEMRLERDKALQELSRLKQHLLEKESEESEKMDEDSKVIEELRESNEYRRAQILHLEKALKQAIAKQDEVKMINNNEFQKSKELIDDLNKRLESCMNTIDSKNVELLNLQTALGQYYAEIEAKEHLEGDLARAREESAKLSQLLKDADHQAEASKREKEEILSKLSQAEKIVVDWKNRVNKLEEDNAKLRRAVEHSMTRLNRMSIDSDYLVDRRIVIKLLVTYFQRNYSKEVLDLMARMLGFSDEDKQRIGVSQGAGKGVVRGVFGLPGRLVGGILGGGSAGASANAASENHSFADLWVDFLLKETEERERRESADDSGRSQEDSHKTPTSAQAVPMEPDHRTSTSGTESGFSRLNLSPIQNTSPLPFRSNFRSEHSDSEFSTVPLTSAESNPYASRLLPRY
ncbi:golgin candidate 4 isoform X1 [Prunus avium]|uniref:Golgin candidate 4 isoform X1 n=1 Tax=Prunus avium TaxID=42229 RepID=A0A6P5S3G0_PRUAV|nr:golgin candidate 4 isoform X1 [Prunus avium]